jgi:hypothetical protein
MFHFPNVSAGIVSYNRNKNIKDILEHRKHSMQLYNRENVCKRRGENYTLQTFNRIVKISGQRGKNLQHPW